MTGATTSGGAVHVAYLPEVLPDGRSLRLAAAVAWHGAPAASVRHGGGGPLDPLRALRHRLWLRLGPLGADVSVAGRPLFGGDSRGPRSVGGVGPHLHGEPLAYYDDGGRVLRILGRVLSAPPPGRTLVALVDATGARAAAPSLALRTVPTPTIAVELPEPEPGYAGTVACMMGGEDPVWAAALRLDPVIRAFLDHVGDE